MSRHRAAWILALLACSLPIGQNPGRVCAEDQATPIRESSPAAIASRPALTQSETIIRAALASKATLDFDKAPLTEVVDRLKQSNRIPLQLDQDRLKAAGIDPASPVTIHVQGISLGSALNLLLSQLKLSYIIRDEVLLITTHEEAANNLVTTVYDVRDLLLTDGKGQPDYFRLENLLHASVENPSWNELGGAGISKPGPLGTLVVTQTERAQDEIEQLFLALRNAKERAVTADSTHSVLVGATLATKKIEKLLSDKIDLDPHKLPLTEFVDGLRKQKGLELFVDGAALKEAGLDPDTAEVTFGGNGISLRSALNLSLAPLDLVSVIDHDVLLITTKDQANAKLKIAIYLIDDFLPTSGSPSTSAAGDAFEIAKTIATAVTDTVGAASWTEQGGPGTLVIYGQDSPRMVISQTEGIHEQIAGLLTQLQEAHRQQQAEAANKPPPPQEPETLTLRVYELRMSGPSGPAMSPQEVTDLVKGLIEPKSWTLPDVYIRGVTGKLVVRQLPSVHREIEKLLDQLGASVPTASAKTPGAPAGPGGGGSF